MRYTSVVLSIWIVIFFALFPLRRVTKYQRVIRILKSKERQHNGQKKKQPSTKHHTENQRSNSTNPTKSGVNPK